MEFGDDPSLPSASTTSEQQESTPEQDATRHDQDLSRYSLSVEEAARLFIQAGVPRAPRTVIRYCSNNTLDCIKVDTLQNLKYLVEPESVRNRIVELQQIAASSHDAPRPDATRHDETIDETRPDTSRHDAPRDETKKIDDLTSRVGELERENKELIAQNRDLEITNRVKDALLTDKENVLEETRNQLSAFGSRIMKFNRAVGELKQMLRLKAPDEDTSQIIAYLDGPTEAVELERENSVDAQN